MKPNTRWLGTIAIGLSLGACILLGIIYLELQSSPCPAIKYVPPDVVVHDPTAFELCEDMLGVLGRQFHELRSTEGHLKECASVFVQCTEALKRCTRGCTLIPKIASEDIKIE